jgi:TetR/AcrR family transcriptional regulator, regulator of biofilm formation and stress response
MPEPVAKRSHGNGRIALLEATMRIVGERGLAGLTMRIVAEEAGVTHGLVRHYFGSRDELVREAFRHAVHLSTERPVIVPGTGSLDDFGAGLGAVVAAAPAEQAFQYEMLLLALRRSDMLADVQEIYADFFRVVGLELEAEGIEDPDGSLARLVFAALDGLVVQQLLYGRARDTETAMIRLREMLKALRDKQRAARTDGQPPA